MSAWERRIKHAYNLTVDGWFSLLESQGGRCAICRTDDSGAKKWAVDHDHSCCPGIRSCGACIRGILCAACNTGLGKFQDSPARLDVAGEYLRRGPVSVPVAFPEAAETRTPRVARPPRDLRSEIKAYAEGNPKASIREVARSVDCAPSTAMEHLRVVRPRVSNEQHHPSTNGGKRP